MDKYKLYNREKRRLEKKFKGHNYRIEKKKFSYGLFNELFDKYHLKEFCETWYDSQEDTDTWYEVEGESYGWMWMNHKPSKRREGLRNYVMKVLHEKNLKPHLYNRNVFYIEMEEYVWVVLPLQDIRAYNLSFIFTKNPNKLGLFG